MMTVTGLPRQTPLPQANGYTLGPNRYGKAACRLVRVDRRAEGHRLVDLSVTTRLSGNLTAVHLSGDNRDVLPTDSQKNTAYAFARTHGIHTIESYALALARHFVASQPAIERARVDVEAYGWRAVDSTNFVRSGDAVRTATVTAEPNGAWVVGGLTGLTLLKTTGSEFVGFARDRFTTLPPATDRLLATQANARWRFASCEHRDWDSAYESIEAALIEAFADTYSRSLQQTLYAMGTAALDACPELAEIRLSLPNKHHFVADLDRFGLDNPDEVYLATDQPYGLIEGVVLRDGAPEAGPAWSDWDLS